MRKNCPNCGELIGIGDKFCQNCGMNLAKFKEKVPAIPQQKN